MAHARHSERNNEQKKKFIKVCKTARLVLGATLKFALLGKEKHKEQTLRSLLGAPLWHINRMRKIQISTKWEQS